MAERRPNPPGDATDATDGDGVGFAADAPGGSTAGPAAGTGDRAAVGFTFDGRAMEASLGQSIAGALLANDVRSLRSTRRAGRPRGLFCGIGNCFDCLVDVGDECAVRACLRPVTEGDRLRTSASVGAAPDDAVGDVGVETQGDRRRLSASGGVRASAQPPGSQVTTEDAELVVLGGGPAGMAAALQAADLGCQVTLVDAGRQLGGQIYRQPNRGLDSQIQHQASLHHSEPGDAGGDRYRTHDVQTWMPSQAEPPDVTAGLPARFRRIASHRSVRRLRSATVWTADRPDGAFDLHLHTPTGARLLRAQALVVATGAAELSLPFPGWELPGVMTAGAAQTLVKADGALPGQRVVVAGSGPFLLPVAATLASAGATVVAVIEASRAWDHRGLALALGRHPSKLREAGGYLATLARHRVPVRTGRAVVAAHGRDQVERVQVARLNRDWLPGEHGREELAVDAVCISYGFVPALEISRALGCADAGHPERPYAAAVAGDDMASTVPGVFLAGETTGIGGAEVAELEGVITGRSAAAYLGHADANAADVPTPVRRRLHRARRFAEQLDAVYRLPTGWLTWLTPDTIVCRCEEVTWSDVRSAVDQGAADLRAVKGTTRCGMGYCQGRICGPPLQLAVAVRSGRPLAQVGDFHTRHIATPVTLSAIATASDRRR